MFEARFLAGVSLSVCVLATVGCAGSDCNFESLNVTPPTATVSHTAAAPANSQTFSASFQFKNNPGSGCVAETASLANSNWTVSDPSVQLSSSPATMVTATCTAAVVSPVTITAIPTNGQLLTGRATLTWN